LEAQAKLRDAIAPTRILNLVQNAAAGVALRRSGAEQFARGDCGEYRSLDLG